MGDGKKPGWAQRVAAGVTVGTTVATGTPEAQADQLQAPDQAQVDTATALDPSITLAQSRHLPPENSGGTLGIMGVGAGMWALWKTRRHRSDDDTDRNR